MIMDPTVIEEIAEQLGMAADQAGQLSQRISPTSRPSRPRKARFRWLHFFPL